MIIPLGVPQSKQTVFKNNLEKILNKNSNLFLFAGDQKIEHLNKDFYGENIPLSSQDPRHLFDIAAQSSVGAFATQLGLIQRYAAYYQNHTINYVVKINSKTDIVSANTQDPISTSLCKIEDIIRTKNEHHINIIGVGYTIYLGSTFERVMLEQAAHIIQQAHAHGLITILWVYPRGKNIQHELDYNLIAGAGGVANCLGADFVKLNSPHITPNYTQHLNVITKAAGNTGVLFSGGPKIEESDFLSILKQQVTQGFAKGTAIGRNIHQKSLADAQEFCQKINIILSQ